jgi:surface carbohydrate biosynthesis protein (TIGR04326 family)
MLECGEKDTLLVWDAEGSPPVSDWTVVLWRDFGDSHAAEAVSIPSLVETDAEDLRMHYLAWIYELGERRIRGRKLVDYLELRPGFSAWWMSLLVEKSYGKSAGIYDSIRMMAFDNWAINLSLEKVVIVSTNQSLITCMRSWSARSGVAFEWRRISDEAENLSWTKRLYQFLPHSLQALIWLVRHLLQCWPLRGVGLPEWREAKGQVTFISYLFNLVPGAAKKGRFESHYWAHLPDNLQSEGCKTNWLHLYVKDELLPTAEKAADAIRKFNNTGQGGQVHVTLDAFLSLRVVIRTLHDWARLAWAGRRLHQALSSSSGSELDLWPLLEEDWQRSMFGVASISNILSRNLFESAWKSLPKQRVGVYLQENQGWEFALIHTWKDAGHGRLIGSPHSSVRYWDLRYFFDSRCYHSKSEYSLPLPDQVALNGAAALDTYQKGDYRAEDMVEVEALRYLYLDGVRAKQESILPPSNGSLRVLVLGDYLLSNTQQQMRLLEKAVRHLPEGTIITVKPHPACPIKPADYPSLKFDVTMEPVATLLGACDVAYTSSVTSAAVDAYCASKPVVSVLDPNTLNLSPLRGREGVVFTSTPEDLAHALNSAASASRSAKRQQDFFTLDSKLPRWRKLLLESTG